MTTILPRNSPLTIGDAIQSAAEFLSGHDVGFGHGTSAASDDAAWLVLEAAGLSPIAQPNYEAIMSNDAINRCEQWLMRRITERKPVAYLVGRMWFAGIEFIVDERALIPRSPIAELILNGFYDLIDTSDSFSVLDLCTGCGCIGIAIASLFPRATVVATDISSDALALAKSNRDRNDLNDRMTLLQGDVFKPVNQVFDVIVSNPPYVDATDLQSMDAEFLHEPELGLASGQDGLDVTRRILAQAADYLKPGGVLIVEVGNSAGALEQAYPALPFLWLEFGQGGVGVFALTREELAPD